MDGSFLSKKEVIDASRNFVCIRLTTYENKKEMEFVKRLMGRPRGSVENTLFAILSPDTKTKFVTPSRTPSWSYSNSTQLAKSLSSIAQKYRKQKQLGPDSSLPATANVKIGLNIASSDNLPLVVLNELDPKKRKELVANLRQLAWDKKYIGKFTYSVAVKSSDLEIVDKLDSKARIIVVQPGEFGLKGKQISSSKEGDIKSIERCLQSGLGRFEGSSKSMFSHMRSGSQQGAFWETELPVTDRMESFARKNTKSQIDRRKKED